LSFFDETDEPPPTRRVRSPAGTGRRPPSDQQVIMIRRAVAALAILVVVIVLALGVHSCQVSSRNSALRNYNTSVGSLVQQSDATGRNLFTILATPKTSSNVQTIQNELFTTKGDAQSQLQQAQNLSPPGQVSDAQQNFVLALSLRRNGIADIASRIQQTQNRTTAQNAIDAIAIDMQEFLASDVVYTTQTAPDIAAALHAAGIAVGVNGETIEPTNFLDDIGWLTPSYVARQLGASLPSTATGGTCPSICGDALNSVSVGGVPLSTGGGNTIPASPPPVFTANFTNTGENPETNTTVQVSVTTSAGTTTTQAVKATTQAGQTYNVQVSLPKAPPTGSATVTVTVEKVGGETNLDNNVLKFPVTFD